MPSLLYLLMIFGVAVIQVIACPIGKDGLPVIEQCSFPDQDDVQASRRAIVVTGTSDETLSKRSPSSSNQNMQDMNFLEEAGPVQEYRDANYEEINYDLSVPIQEITDPVLRLKAFKKDVMRLNKVKHFLLPITGYLDGRPQRRYQVIEHPSNDQIEAMLNTITSKTYPGPLTFAHVLQDPVAERYRAVFDGTVLDISDVLFKEYNEQHVTEWNLMSTSAIEDVKLDAAKAIVALSSLRARYELMLDEIAASENRD